MVSVEIIHFVNWLIDFCIAVIGSAFLVTPERHFSSLYRHYSFPSRQPYDSHAHCNDSGKPRLPLVLLEPHTLAMHARHSLPDVYELEDPSLILDTPTPSSIRSRNPRYPLIPRFAYPRPSFHRPRRCPSVPAVLHRRPSTPNSTSRSATGYHLRRQVDVRASVQQEARLCKKSTDSEAAVARIAVGVHPRR